MPASVPQSPDPHPAETYPVRPAAAAGPVSAGVSGARAAEWLALGAAALGVVLGVLIMAWPEATLRVVAVLFGIWLLVHGVVRIVQAITGAEAAGTERAVMGMIGVFFVVAGVITLRNLLASLALVMTLVGLMWLVGGILELISAFGGPSGKFRVWNMALGLLSIGAALIVFLWPSPSLTTLVYITGVWLIVASLLQMAMIVWIRRSPTA